MTSAAQKFTRFTAFLGLLGLSASLACSSADGPGTGTAGTPAVAGSASGGAGAGQGGAAAGTGGVGTAGKAGSASTGGSGSSGTASTAGSSGTASTAGSGGTAGGSGGSGGKSGGSGGASGGTGGGSGGSSSFAPCPATGACKVLPLGDSITFGLGYDGGYRVELFRLAHSEGHDITFTGTQTPNGPSMVDGVSFPKQHAGISGQTIDQIAGRVPTPDLGGMPNIILVHAGTNDMYGSAPATAHERLAKMMDKLIKEAPNALLVFATIVPITLSGGQYADETMAFNSHVEAFVKERADKGSHIIFLDQFKDFPSNELGDMVHPNKAGYERMATKFYGAIKSYLK